MLPTFQELQVIALNCRFTGTPQPTGTQTAAFELFDAILHASHKFNFTVFADDRFPGVKKWAGRPGVNLVFVPFQDMSRGGAQIWEQLRLPKLCRAHLARLAHHPITTSPITKVQGCKSLVTLHDLNFHRHPEWFSWKFRLLYQLLVVPALKRADQVVAISNYVLSQALESFQIDAKRMQVIYNGSRPLSVNAPKTGNYLLCVGSLQPHKNLPRLIHAFLKIAPEFPGLELHIAGRAQAQFTRDAEIEKLLHSPGVVSLGYVPDDELGNLYAGARVFCFPSLEEGFGLPVLEAMNAGTPVLTSNVSCLPEIAGPSACLVDPSSVDSIAEGLRSMLNLPVAQRDQTSETGKHWAARFTWQKAAEQYLHLYQELL